MGLRFLLGLLKGVVIGVGLGYAAYALGLGSGWGYLVYGLVGFAVGMLVGKPFWSHLVDKQSTIVTSVLKGLFGFGVGAGLYALASRVLPDPSFAFAGDTRTLTGWQPIFGAVVGGLYGSWIEVDDAPAKSAPATAKPTKSR